MVANREQMAGRRNRALMEPGIPTVTIAAEPDANATPIVKAPCTGGPYLPSIRHLLLSAER